MAGFNISRRKLIAALPFAGAAAALPVSASDLGKWTADPDTMTLEQRRDYHLAEYQKAAQELDPSIDRWSSSDLGMRIVVTGHRVSGRYVGDGYYDIRGSSGMWQVNYVQLSADRIDGERTFKLFRWGQKGRHYMRVTEPRLSEIIGAPHSGRFGATT